MGEGQRIHLVTVNESDFPKLRDSGFELKSDADESYNCIAWAAGENTRWWEPIVGRYWPEGAGRLYTVEALMQAYAARGFVECSDAVHEEGVQKIAIYGANDEYLHVARQLRNGLWTSKLGPDEDICHHSFDALMGDAYGQVVKLMARPYPQEDVLGDE